MSFSLQSVQLLLLLLLFFISLTWNFNIDFPLYCEYSKHIKLSNPGKFQNLKSGCLSDLFNARSLSVCISLGNSKNEFWILRFHTLKVFIRQRQNPVFRICSLFFIGHGSENVHLAKVWKYEVFLIMTDKVNTTQRIKSKEFEIKNLILDFSKQMQMHLQMNLSYMLPLSKQPIYMGAL